MTGAPELQAFAQIRLVQSELWLGLGGCPKLPLKGIELFTFNQQVLVRTSFHELVLNPLKNASLAAKSDQFGLPPDTTHRPETVFS